MAGLTFLLSCLLLTSTARATSHHQFIRLEKPTPLPQSDLPDIPRHPRNRVFWLSSDAPVTKYLTKIPDFSSICSTILEYIQHIEVATITKLSFNSSATRNSLIRPCNFDNDFARGILEGRNRSNTNRGYPEADATCFTEHFGPKVNKNEKPLFPLPELFRAMTRRGDLIKANIEGIVASAINNYTRPDFVYNFPYNTSTKSCVLHVAAAFRLHRRWYLRTQLTNIPIHEHAQDWGRQYVSEYISVGEDGNLTWPITRAAYEIGRNGIPGRLHRDTTTTINNRRWSANPAHFTRLLPKDNPAIHDALQKSEFHIRQATDTLYPSNIAILILPLALNLIPIALFSDASTTTILMYAILSDILTALPLLIKGIELVQISNQRHQSVVTRMTSPSNGTYASTAFCEMWTAECRSKENVGVAGYIFVTMATVFMLGGLVAEFVTQRYRKRISERFSVVEGLGNKPLKPRAMRYSSQKEKEQKFEPLQSPGANHIGLDSEEYDSLYSRKTRSEIPKSV